MASRTGKSLYISKKSGGDQCMVAHEHTQTILSPKKSVACPALQFATDWASGAHNMGSSAAFPRKGIGRLYSML